METSPDRLHAGQATTGARSGYVIAPDSPRTPDVVALLDAGASYLESLYPPENTYFFDIDRLDVPEMAFYVARRPDGDAVGTAAFLGLGVGRAEIKRMYVDPGERGRGLASDLLDRLEADAREAGFAELVLETGTRQVAALALYRASGYRTVPAFGEYVHSAYSVCMAKAL